MVAVPILSSSSSGTCEPRWATPRSPERPSFGRRLVAVAERLGLPLMPWQRLVAEVAGELVRDEETGLLVPAYPEVVVTVPRQNGKTTLLLVWELDRALLWEPFDGKPQSIAYTAQSGSDARKKFRKDQIPLLKRSPFWPGVAKVRLAAEDTGLEFTNGATLSVWSNSREAGHGETVDLGVMDEIFADEDDRREQALIPAMATRHDRQKLVTSTAGTERSLVLARKQANGRRAVEEGRRHGIAYFEWSAHPDADPEDPATWRACMPALGHTISERTVAAALEEMRKEDGDLSEFRRAWLNIPQRSDGSSVIPLAVWRSVCGDVVPSGRIVLAVDATPDQSAGSIVAADETGRAELVDHRAGTGWLAQRAVEVARRWNAPVVVDERGPVSHLIGRLEDADVQVIRCDTKGYADACSGFVDDVVAGNVSVRSHRDFTVAVDGARKRSVGDRWVWARKGVDVDISPLVALTLALWHRDRIRPAAATSIVFV